MSDMKKALLCGGSLIFGAAMAAFSVLIPESENVLSHAVDLCIQFVGIA